MSWRERVFMPKGKGATTLTKQQYQARDVEKGKVVAGNHQKVNTKHMKWFVVYADTDEIPAHLEYHDNENSWRAGNPPGREVIIKDCWNICRKPDSPIITLYTLKDCLGIRFHDDTDLQVWLGELLGLQKGPSLDGKLLKPNFEHIYQVQAKFKALRPDSTFSMSGTYRLCLTREDMMFFPIGSDKPIIFQVMTLRQGISKGTQFQVDTGRRSTSGEGKLEIVCEDNETASDLASTYLKTVEELRQQSDQLKSSVPRWVQRQQEQQQLSRSGAGSSYRPRSESDPKSKTPVASSVPKTSHLHNISHGDSVSRHRTTSEGAPFEAFPKPPSRRTKVSAAMSGSPISPSPGGSYMSSESAGSSNSIDDEYRTERKLTSSAAIEQATIVEENSAGSWADPEPAEKGTSNRSNGGALGVADGSQHQRTHSDTVQYAPIDILEGAGAAAAAATAASPPAAPVVMPAPQQPSSQQGAVQAPTQYVTFVQPTNSDYMVMSPTSGNNSSAGSLKRHASLDQSSVASSAEHRRLQMLPDDVEKSATVTSPSSQSSFNPLEDLEADTAYCVMSPIGSVGKTAAAAASKAPADDYVVMSPLSEEAKAAASALEKNKEARRGNLDILLNQPSASNQEYEVMSPVSVDQERLRAADPPSLSAIEERLGGELPVHLRGARPNAPRSKRSSLCSEQGVDALAAAVSHPVIDNEGVDPNNPAYVPIDYSSRQQAMPIPIKGSGGGSGGGGGGKMSPHSYGSLVSGTPNSESRYLEDADEFQIDTKSVSYLRQSGDDAGGAVAHTRVRSYTVTPGSSTSSVGGGARSRTPSVVSSSAGAGRFIEIPGGAGKAAGKYSPSFHRFSPGTLSVPPATAGGLQMQQQHHHQQQQGSSQAGFNIMARLDTLFRSRAGSVPTRPNMAGRRRHRTQSEGEKDSADNQEATEATVAAEVASVVSEMEDAAEEAVEAPAKT